MVSTSELRDLEELGKLSLCMHEAAHAVVAWRSDIEVDLLKLDYGWWSGDLHGGHIMVSEDPEWEQKVQGYAAVYAAGRCAQEKYLLQEGVDSALAARIAEYGGSLDADDMVDLQKHFKVSDSEARTAASSIIEANWELIQEVGLLLDLRGKLAGRVAK